VLVEEEENESGEPNDPNDNDWNPIFENYQVMLLRVALDCEFRDEIVVVINLVTAEKTKRLIREGGMDQENHHSDCTDRVPDRCPCILGRLYDAEEPKE